MNKPIVMATALAVIMAVVASGQAYAQYPGSSGDQPIGITTPAQLEECKTLEIIPANCNDNSILAARKVGIANANPSTGSGTSMLAGETGTMAAFIGILGAIFGGVAAAFFIKGRGAKPVST